MLGPGPFLSLPDPDGAGESSLDPLGLTPLGEQLAVELIPGVRQRQSHPRYLTAIAVSHSICDGFPPETVAADGVSEPWQVFEWYLVEGLVRTAGHWSDTNVPGSQKAYTAIRQNLPLCAASYLKTPSIFGFHGVYRLLARTLSVEHAGFLSDFGFELLEVWQKEQDLSGFHGSSEGFGKAARARLLVAMERGLKSGATVGSSQWWGWQFFADRLEPTKAGPHEREIIWRQLRSGVSGFRREALDFAVSAEARAAYEAKKTERELYVLFSRTASPELAGRIKTILRYEAFCRLLHDAFESMRWALTTERRGLHPKKLAALNPVSKAAARLPAAFERAAESFVVESQRLRYTNTFALISESRTATDFVVALLQHHRRIQDAKPPGGKSAWIEQHPDGSLMLRPQYRPKKEPVSSDEFVNPYRLAALRSFATDLGKL